ncbi:lytic transglycosylase domain-containing protein [Elioraea sp.]|uniref:lytic transglycosylase domain-containing protein n=1 Tax=Elioraea sp. TaxID=2185103 RepID=UPI003F7021D8
MMFRFAALIVGLFAAMSLTGFPAHGTHALAAEDPAQLCRPAIRAAERAHGLPVALLSALGRVESGRRDPESGSFGPWPGTINAEGRGQFFPTKAEAIAEVRRLQARGVRSIDIGCMQVNLMFHPHAFASLEEAFDPARNADYAARFLVELQQKANSWLQAAAHYHSHTPEFAEAYRRRVVAAWPEESRLAAQAQRETLIAAWHARPATVPGGPGRVMSMAPTGRVQAQSGGRDLSAYRAAPIPLVGRALTPVRLRR